MSTLQAPDSSHTPDPTRPTPALARWGESLTATTPKLSKSRYISGLQCGRRLWLEIHRRDLATPPDATLQRRFDTGAEIGVRAHELFPGGVLIEEGREDFERAAARTGALLADPSVPALFEPAFEHREVRIRVDVLERLPGGRFRLVEVKSGTSVKDVHLDDLAIQQWVLEGAGVAVESAWLLHVNRNYVRSRAGIHWPSFFKGSDQSAPVANRVRLLATQVAALHATAAVSQAPQVEPGPHCRKPYDCPFRAHCTRNKPADWVGTLPSVTPLRLKALRDRRIEKIVDIPADFPLSAVQARMRAVLRGDSPQLGPGLGEALGGCRPPFFALDFETMNPAVPIYPETRPYQRIPFQWSLHRVDDQGQLTHQGFLAEGRDDPRREVAEQLVAASSIPRTVDDPVLVWSGFEASVLGDLAHQFPDLAPGLQRLRERLVDLLPIVREHVYKPELAGSYSLKRVAPALAPGFSFDGLSGVAAGGDAALAFERIARRELSAAAEAELRRALEAYCERDTHALVALMAAQLRAT